MPPQPVQRYLVEKMGSPLAIWRFNHKCRTIPASKRLRLEVLAPAVVRWSVNGWLTVQDTETQDTGLGVHCVDLPTERLPGRRKIEFTFYWLQAKRWEGVNFAVMVE